MLTKQFISYQNNIAKESLSLQNHIVWPCFIFITQNAPIMHNPSFSQAIDSYFLMCFNLYNPHAIHELSHGYSTMGGVEYDDGGYVEKTKKEKVSH